MADTVPQRIVRRVIGEKRAGAPDEMIARYAITEALHAITGHDGTAADCTRCHEAMARAVDDVRTLRPLDLTGCSIVVPDPLNLPAYQWGETPVPTDPDGADPVAVAVESALTPDAAAEYAAGFLTRWAAYADGNSDEPPGDLAPEYLHVLLAERKQILHRLTNPCNGEDCETGGALHCHRCAEAESDGQLAERDRLRTALTEILGAFHGAYYGGSSGESQWMSRSQWIPTVTLDVWRALVGIEASGAPVGEPGRAHGG